MHEYKTARSIFSFMEFCAWAIVAVGVIILFAGAGAGSASFGRASNMAAVMGALPGIAIAMMGLLAVMGVQIGRATVDTAEMTGKMLKNSDDQMAMLRAQSAPGERGKAGFTKEAARPSSSSSPQPLATPAPAERTKVLKEQPAIPSSAAPASTISHNGKTIRKDGDFAYVGMMRFDDVGAARNFIDEKLIPSEKPALKKPDRIEHMGRSIALDPDGVRVDGVRFDTIERAKSHIERSTLRATR